MKINDNIAAKERKKKERERLCTDKKIFIDCHQSI